MRWLWLVMSIGCAEHGELPTSCEPDLVLVGRPGGDLAEVPVVLARHEIFESCVVVDASQNEHDVTFVASSPAGNSIELVLYSVDGTFLVSDERRGVLEYVLPPGPTMHFQLSAVPASNVLSARFALTLLLFEAQ